MHKKFLVCIIAITVFLSGVNLEALNVDAAQTAGETIDSVSEESDNMNSEDNQISEDIREEDSGEGENDNQSSDTPPEEENTDEELKESGNISGENGFEQTEKQTLDPSADEMEKNEDLQTQNEENASDLAEDSSVDSIGMLDQMANDNRENLPDGTYYIRANFSETKVLETQNGSTSNKTRVILNTFAKKNNQRWKVVHDEKGYVTFINEKSGKALDVANGGREGNKTVWQYNANGTAAQKWIAIKDETNYIFISALGENISFSINGNSAEIADVNGADSQKFQMINVSPKVPKCDEYIKSGWYYIKPASNTDYAIDVQNKSGANKANIQLGKSDSSTSQMFFLQYDDGYYSVRNRNSGKMLDIEQGGFMPTTNVWQYNDNSTKAQRWALQKNDNGSYTFISVHNGMALDISKGAVASGNNIQVYTPNQSIAQQWKLQLVDDNEMDNLAAQNKGVLSDGTYYIRSELNNWKVVDIKGGAKSNKSSSVITQFNKSTNQRWKVVHDALGYVTFINEKSGKALDVANGGRNGSRTVWQYTPNNTFAQKWVVEKNGAHYRIISALNKNLVLDVKGGSDANNTSLQIYQKNNTTAQNFQFIAIDPKIEKCDEIVPSGIYYICSKKNDKFALDIKSGSDKNKANVQLYTLNNTFAQAFEIKYNNGYYSIRNCYSNKMLDVANGGFMPTTNVWQYNSNGSKAQSWSLRDNGDGSYTFISAHNGMALDISNGTIASGSNIQVYTPNQTEAQKFVLKPGKEFYEGVYNITPKVSLNRCAEIEGGKTGDKTKIQIYNSNGTDSQKWTAIENADGTFRFVNVKSGKVLDVSNGTMSSGNSVWAYHYNGTAAQKWKVEKQTDGSWYILSAKDESYALSLKNGTSENRAKLVIEKRADVKAQKWIFHKATTSRRILGVQFDEGSEFVINKGDTYQLEAREIFTTSYGRSLAWKSSDNDMVTVSDRGEITALRSGNVTITATSKTDKKMLARIKVYVSEQDGEVTREELDKLELQEINKLMIVAHPDDETFWGGGHLVNDDYLVVCITNGWHPVRKNEFIDAMKFSGDKALILDYPDISQGNKDTWEYSKAGIMEDIDTLLDYKEWDTIVVHNPDGEYGHIHHKMLSSITEEISKEKGVFEKLYYFGKYYSKGKVPAELEPNINGEVLNAKKEMCKLYRSQYGAYEKNWDQMEAYEYWVKATEW